MYIDLLFNIIMRGASELIYVFIYVNKSPDYF